MKENRQKRSVQSYKTTAKKKKKLYPISYREGNPMKKDKREDTKEKNAAIISNHGRGYYFLSFCFEAIASEVDSMEKGRKKNEGSAVEKNGKGFFLVHFLKLLRKATR